MALLLIAGAAAWWKRDTFLKAIAARAIHRSTGLRVEIRAFQTGAKSGAVSMQGLRLYNYPEFGGSVLLDVPELVVELDRELAAAGRLRFKQLRLNLAELNVIQDSAGRWNFERLEREMTARNAARTNRAEPRLEFAGIDEMHLTLGRIRYTDLKRSGRSRDIRVGVTNETVAGIRTEEQLQEWIGSFLFRVILQEVAQPTEQPRRPPKAKDVLKDALAR